MELARLILEYLKVLAWPIVTMCIILVFRRRIDSILRTFGERITSAEKLKLDVMGQGLEISGTAKELMKQADQLVDQTDDKVAQTKAKQIEKSLKQLSSPLADFIGIALLRSRSRGLSLEEIMQQVLAHLGTKTSETSPGAMFMLSTTFEKIMAELVELDLVSMIGEKYHLTGEGRSFFEKVADKQQRFLQRFGAIGDRPKGAT